LWVAGFVVVAWMAGVVDDAAVGVRAVELVFEFDDPQPATAQATPAVTATVVSTRVTSPTPYIVRGRPRAG
jgi:hypothetical protein